MLRLIWWQFSYSWRKWLGTLVVFSAAGLFVGFTAIGSFSAIAENVARGNFNPVELFMMPTIFGAIALILVIKGMIKLLINSFQKDYSLWAILGANPRQLARLISGQMLIISLVGATIGYLLAYPILIQLYAWIRMSPGMQQFPNMYFQLSLWSWIATLASTGFISWIMSYIDTYRILVGKISYHQKRSKVFAYLGIIISLASLVYLYRLFFIRPNALRMLLGNFNEPLTNIYTPLFFGLILLIIININFAAPFILPLLLNLIKEIVPSNYLRTFTTAYWQVYQKKDFLQTIVIPLFIVTLLISFFGYLAVDLADVASKHSLSGLLGTLAIFLGAPVIIVLANAISVTIISSTQRNATLQQLQILGFSVKDLLWEKCGEALLYATLIFIIGTISNTALFAAIVQAAHHTNVIPHSSWITVTYLPAVAAFMVFGFIVIIDSGQLKYENSYK